MRVTQQTKRPTHPPIYHRLSEWLDQDGHLSLTTIRRRFRGGCARARHAHLEIDSAFKTASLHVGVIAHVLERGSKPLEEHLKTRQKTWSLGLPSLEIRAFHARILENEGPGAGRRRDLRGSSAPKSPKGLRTRSSTCVIR